MRATLLSLFLILLLSGCGTKAARVEKVSGTTKIYPATSYDAGVAYLTCCTNFIHMEGKQPLGAAIALRTIIPVLAIIDIPISLLTDTVFLPYDLYRWNNYPEEATLLKQPEVAP